MILQKDELFADSVGSQTTAGCDDEADKKLVFVTFLYDKLGHVMYFCTLRRSIAKWHCCIGTSKGYHLTGYCF